jgi:hypothetical protein
MAHVPMPTRSSPGTAVGRHEPTGAHRYDPRQRRTWVAPCNGSAPPALALEEDMALEHLEPIGSTRKVTVASVRDDD